MSIEKKKKKKVKCKQYNGLIENLYNISKKSKYLVDNEDFC